MKISGDKLEYLEDDIEELAYFGGKPFTGETEDIKSGYLHKSVYKDGYEHGLSEGYFPNGIKYYERQYIDGMEVKSCEWYESGQIKEKKECITPSEYDYVFQRWCESGTLVYKTDTSLNKTQGWYETGQMKFEENTELSKYFDKCGGVAFFHKGKSPHEDNEPFSLVSWNDNVIEKCFDYLANDELLFVFIWHWIEMKLDEESEIGYQCLESLTENESFNTAARAIHLIGCRNVLKLKHILEKNKRNKRKQPPGSSGWQSSIGEIASKALSEINANKRVN